MLEMTIEVKPKKKYGPYPDTRWKENNKLQMKACFSCSEEKELCKILLLKNKTSLIKIVRDWMELVQEKG